MKRILIVEDSRVARELVKVYLIAKDVALVEAEDGQDALEKIRADPPDLVLADMKMPRLDGAGLSQALRGDPATRSIPVIILTSAQDPETRRRALESGAREVLLKPIRPDALNAAVKRYLPDKPVPRKRA